MFVRFEVQVSTMLLVAGQEEVAWLAEDEYSEVFQ